jgi:hypothetical protein
VVAVAAGGLGGRVVTDEEREMLFGLAEELAGYVVIYYKREDFQDSPTINDLARVAAMMEANRREVPPIIHEALQKAAEAGRTVCVA